MTIHEVGSYLPASYFTENKEGTPGKLCREELAVICLSEPPCILAGRGAHLMPGELPQLPQEELCHLRRAPTEQRSVAVLLGEHAWLLFPELFPATGLCLLLQPLLPVATVAHTLPYFGTSAPLPSAALSALPQGCTAQQTEECYRYLSQQFSLLHSILTPQRNFDFRLLCAHIAELAGCRVQVTELPVGYLPLHEADLSHWTAFLLCCFLALRGDSAKGPNLTLEEAHIKSFHLKLSHTSERQGKRILSSPRFAFLSLPCFSDFQLSKTERGFVMLTTLRRSTDYALSALSVWEELFCLEIEELS